MGARACGGGAARTRSAARAARLADSCFSAVLDTAGSSGGGGGGGALPLRAANRASTRSRRVCRRVMAGAPLAGLLAEEDMAGRR